jgi:hypothetical protein
MTEKEVLTSNISSSNQNFDYEPIDLNSDIKEPLPDNNDIKELCPPCVVEVPLITSEADIQQIFPHSSEETENKNNNNKVEPSSSSSSNDTGIIQLLSSVNYYKQTLLYYFVFVNQFVDDLEPQIQVVVNQVTMFIKVQHGSYLLTMEV